MKITLQNHLPFLHVTDNSHECDATSIFLKTNQNSAYEQDAINRGCTKIISAQECLSLLGIEGRIKIIGITGTNGKTTT